MKMINVVGGILFFWSILIACPYTFRQAGFVDIYPFLYSAYLVVDNSTSKNIIQWYNQLSTEILDGSNVEPKIVNIDSEPSHKVANFCRSLKVSTFPAIVLCSPEERYKLIACVSEDKGSKDWIKLQLKKIVSSPIREEIKNYITSNWCIVLFVESGNSKEDQIAKLEIESAIAKITGLITETGVVIKSGPKILTISAEEEILLWSLGIEDPVVDGPMAVVIYGRARQLGPIFKKSSITASALYNIFFLLGRRCVCTTDRSWLSIRQLPMKWPIWYPEEVLKAIGIDVNSPLVKSQIAPGMRWLVSTSDEALEEKDYLPGLEDEGVVYGPMGYTEYFIKEEEPEEQSFIPMMPPIHPEEQAGGLSFGGELKRIVLFAAGGLVIVAGIGGVIIWLRRRKGGQNEDSFTYFI